MKKYGKYNRSYVPAKWTTEGVNPEKLSDQTIDRDRWDEEDLRNQLQQVPPFSAARTKLNEFAYTGKEAFNDAFFALLKADPQLLPEDKIKPSYLVNRQIIEMALTMDELAQLRQYSVSDDVQAALSAVTIEPDLESLFDRTKKQRDQAQQLQDALQELAQALSDLDQLEKLIAQAKGDDDEDGEGEGEGQGEGKGEGEPGDDGKGQGQGQGEGLGQQKADLRDLIDKLKQAAEDAKIKFEESMNKGQGSVRVELSKALKNATEEAKQSQETARAWGLEPGEMQRMDAKERLELAKRLNNPRFRRIADLFGPMRNLMLSEQKRKTIYTKEEVFDVGIGNDLDRVLPQEIINLRSGPTRLDFLRRYTEGQLLVYELRGEEKLSKGNLIYCEDGSGSMSGERELYSKAIMLVCLHLCRQQKRSMHVVHFGSPGQYKHIPFVNQSDFSLDRILDAAELFFSGGTDFSTPMKVALGLLQTEHGETGKVDADVVFVTDGECAVPSPFMKEYIEEMHRMQCTTWGIDVSGGGRSAGALMEMSEDKVASVADLLTGNDIREVFRGL